MYNRKFNGKNYTVALANQVFDKPTAQKHAKKFRKNGYLARVVKVTAFKHNQTLKSHIFYMVYIH